jgi:general stress protein 26
MTTRKESRETLARLIERLDIAMFTTVGRGGDLVSRPLSTQTASFDGESVWFFTERDSPKIAEIRRHPKVNLAYASKSENAYVSAAGSARVLRDQALIDRFWSDALKAFFPKGPTDPNLVLIEVRLRTVEYWEGPGSWIGKAVSYVAALVTGNDDVMGENRLVDMKSGRSRKPAGTDRPGRARTAKRSTAKAPRRAAGARKSTAKR